jgi:hypothetical protein
MQVNEVRLSLISLLVFLTPTWVTAQDALRSKDSAFQQSIQSLLTAPALSAQSSLGSPLSRPADPTPWSAHEKFATFLAGDFKSTLLLENFRADLPITFRPTLILNDGEVGLDPVTVTAHSSTTVDISAVLTNRRITETHGTVAIQFDFTSYGPGAAVVQMRDDKHHVFLNSYAQSPEEYWSGTTYDAVVWAPHEETDGFVSITNASTETHTVHVAFLRNGKSEQQEIQIPARHMRILPLEDLLNATRKSGAGIHIEYDQSASEEYPGAILVEGQLFNRKTGFAKNIHFMDKALPPTGTLRTHFLLLGRQSAEDNFPFDVSFRSVAAVRNIDTVPVGVTPTLKFVRNNTTQKVKLPSRTLRPDESILIDFQEEQKAGRLPQDLNQSSLELTPDTGRASIVGELFNFSQSGGYVVGPSFTSYPNRGTSSIWRTDGSFQTTVMIENTAREHDRVAVHLYSERGQYSKTFDVPAGALIKINLKELQQNQVADDQGNFLVDTFGVMSLIGSRNTLSKLSFDKIVHSTDQSDYVGLPPSPCDFVSQIAMWIDTSSGSNPFPVMKTYYWTISGAYDAPQHSSVASDTSLAQISNGTSNWGSGDLVTFSPPNDGTTHTVSISPPSFSELAEFCDACSFGEVPVLAASGILIRIALTSWGPPPTQISEVCHWQNLACATGTPTCLGQVGLIFSPSLSCPSYVLIEHLVINGACFLPAAGEPAAGPGPCN